MTQIFYAAYSKTTQRLTRVGSGDEKSIRSSLGQQEDLIVLDPATIEEIRRDIHSYAVVDGTIKKTGHPIDHARMLLARRLEHQCQVAITNGFESGDRRYPADETSQLNMLECCVAGGKLSCCDGGHWQLKQHTPEQARQVLSDFAVHKDAQRSKLESLIQKMNSVSTTPEIEAVVW